MSENLSQKIFKSFKQLLSGQAVFTIVGFFAAYFYARLLGPETYGTWQTAKVFTQYTMIFAFGLPFVMRRDFIQLRGEGKIKESENMANQVFSYSIITGPLFSVVLFSIALFFTKDSNFSLALTAVGVINLFNVISSYGDILNKGFNKYHILRNSQLLLSISTLLTVFLVYMWGFHGLLIGLISGSFINAVYYYVFRPLNFRWYWSFSLLKRMILIGFPIYLQNIVSVIFSSIDRLIIAGFLSFKEVGHYSLSALIKVPVTLLISTLGVVVFTQLNEKYGKDKSPKVIKLHMETPQLFASYILAPFIVLGIIILPFLVTNLLPEYEPGIVPAQIFVFAVLFLTLAGFSSNALFILNKQKIAAVAFTVAGIIKTFGSLFLLKLGYGISGVAIATLVAYFIYDSIMVWQVKKQIGEVFNFKFVLVKNIPVLYTISIFAIVQLIIQLIRVEKNIAIQLMLYFILLIPYYFIAKQKMNHIIKRIKGLV